MVRGGLDFSLPTWLDVSKNMVLSSTTAIYTMEETGPAFGSGSSFQTVFNYTYNTQNLPVSMEKKDTAGRFVYQITFSY